MASSFFLLSYLLASLITFSAAFTALGRANPSQASLVPVHPCNVVLKLPSSAVTQTTVTVLASELSFADPYAWKSVMDDARQFEGGWGARMTNWGYFDVSELKIGVTYGVFYQLTAKHPVTSTVSLKLTLPDGYVTPRAERKITVVPKEYEQVQVGSFINTYSSGSIKFEMTTENPGTWANNLIINSVVINEQ